MLLSNQIVSGDKMKIRVMLQDGNKTGELQAETVDGPPATAELKAKEIPRMRSQLPRRETTIATLVNSEYIGLRTFLYKRRVRQPGLWLWRGRQTAKHTIMFCAKWDRAVLFEAAGIRDLPFDYSHGCRCLVIIICSSSYVADLSVDKVCFIYADVLVMISGPSNGSIINGYAYRCRFW